MAITTDELRIVLKINGAASYTTTMNQIVNVTKNYESTVGKLMTTLVKIVATGAIAKFSKQCIEAASNLQEVANVVNVTFGKTAGIVNDWAKKQAASFGLSETAAKRYLGTFGTMGKQFQFTEEQAAAMSIELTKLSGDVASFYNISDSSAANKLKAIFTGETESLKELGVVMTQTQLDAYAMSKGWNKTTKDMTEQEKVALRYSYTMEKLSHVQGDFSRTSDGYANSVRTMQLELENMKVQVGKELLPVAAQGIQFVIAGIRFISPIVQSIAQTVRYYAEAWKNASEKTKGFAKAALACLIIMAVVPKVIGIIRGAVKLLTIDVLTLQGALSLLALIFAALAFKDLTASVKEMKASADKIEDMADSADLSTEALDALSDSVEGLGNSSKELKRFLAPFDEVNKVGGGGSLMSQLVTLDDLNNLSDLTSSIGDLQGALDGIHMPSILPEGIFTKKFWTDLGADIMGFVNEVFFEPGEFWADWKRGFDTIIDSIQSVGEWLDEVAPKWSNFWNNAGFDIYDLTHDKNGKPKVGAGVGTLVLDSLLGANEEDKSGSFTAANGITYAKYGADGTLSKPYEDYIRSNARASAGTAAAAGPPAPQVYVNVEMDGEKVSKNVTTRINNSTNSSGNSPLSMY